MTTKIPLLGGSYQARSVIADAQRCVNMFPEKNQASSELPYTYYPTPGLVKFAQGPFGAVRGMYSASNDRLYAAINGTVFRVNSNGTLVTIGSITPGTTPVRFIDNTLEMVVFDGTVNGWVMDLNSEAFSAISDPAWYGSTGGGYVDSFMVFNRPGTRQWYTTLPNQFLPLDPLYFASKTVSSDPLLTITVRDRSILLLGQESLEFWYNAGGAAFPFQIQAGAYEDTGISSPYSLAQFVGTVFWLAKNKSGYAQAVMCTEYQVNRISNYAIEAEWSTYNDISDAIGFCYQRGGHVFYVLTFPSADKTWVYDLSEDAWHQRAYLETDGTLSRHRANCHAFAFDKQLVGDYENGAIYEMSDTAYTDDGRAIRRIRSFPTLGSDQKRVAYNRMVVEMEVGSALVGSGSPHLIELRYSNDYGKTWSNSLIQSLGLPDDFLRSVVWTRLGLGRNRVFEVSWSFNGPTALKGAFIELEVSET